MEPVEINATLDSPKPKGRPRGSTNRPKGATRPQSTRVTGEVSPQALESLHQLVLVAVAGAAIFMPEGLRPTDKDVDAIFKPAERIYLRHASVPEVSPDAQDALAMFIGIVGYASHVRLPASRRKQSGGLNPNAAPASASPGNVASNGGGARAGGANPHGASATHGPSEIMANLYRESYLDESRQG